MGKKPKQKGKKASADQVRNRKLKNRLEVIDAVKTNPFEVKVNRQKHFVVGKKLTKFDKGIPGVSRSRGVTKRKETLLVEYRNKNKANRLIDNRIGEKNAALNEDDKMMERFTTEKKKQHANKTSIFNLDEDDDADASEEDELTHMGQSLREIEKFDDRPVEASSDEDDDGQLTGDIVSEGHFGGGVLQKTGSSEQQQEKTFKERMEEMITKSKLAKHERQAEKDELMQLTDKLDDQWRSLHNEVAKIKRRGDEEDDMREADTYDIAVNKLKFESRGNPTDRLKTEAELAKLEREKLEKLEQERQARMRGETTKTKGAHRAHLSADDLDDGMDYDMGDQEEFVARYKDGQLILPESDEVESDDNSDYDEEDDEYEDQSGDDEEADSGSDEQEEGSGDEDDSDQEDQYSDLESGGEMESGEEMVNSNEEVVSINGEANVKAKKNKKKSPKGTSELSHIPYTFNVPGSYTALIELLDKYSLEDQNIVIVRMRKCNHPSLSADNKEHLIRLFGYLLEYVGDISLRVPVPISLIDHLTVHLFEISKQFPQPTAAHTRHILLERQKLFTLYCQSKSGRGIWPFLDLLVYFKLIGVLYPTSDLRHEVVTPAMLFASQIYSSCPIVNHRDVAVGLMLTTIMCEYVAYSKRLMPECINFLSALLYTALPLSMSATAAASSNKITVATSSAKPGILVCKACGNQLRSTEVKTSFNLNEVIARGVGNSIYNTDGFILTALNMCLSLLGQFLELYKSLPASEALFSHCKQALVQLNSDDMPELIQESITMLRSSLDDVSNMQLDYVCKERKKPKVLKLYEPSFDDNFELGKKKIAGDKLAAEKQKLKHQYKKEMKSAMREVRKDRAFIAEQTIKEKIKRDAERQKKTNKILSDLQGQQYEINMYNKMSKKPKHR